MTVITGWRAELAIIDGAQVMMSRTPGSMTWPAFWCEVLDDAHGWALKEDRDRQWVKSAIGDVEPESKGIRFQKNLIPVEMGEMKVGWDPVTGILSASVPYRFPDYFGETVPVESLGRNDG